MSIARAGSAALPDRRAPDPGRACPFDFSPQSERAIDLLARTFRHIIVSTDTGTLAGKVENAGNCE
jgi:hypothetical protein